MIKTINIIETDTDTIVEEFDVTDKSDADIHSLELQILSTLDINKYCTFTILTRKGAIMTQEDWKLRINTYFPPVANKEIELFDAKKDKLITETGRELISSVMDYN